MLITVDKEVLRQLVAQIEKDGLSILNPQFVGEIVESIKHPRGKSLNRSLKTLPPEIANEIIGYIQMGEFKEPPEWPKKLTAHRYAEDLFKAAHDRKQVDECYSSLQLFPKLFEDTSWVAFLEDPNIRFSDKHKILRLTGDNQLVVKLICELLDKHETGLLLDIAEEFRNLIRGSSIIRAEVITAVSIGQEYEKKIMGYLEKMFNTKVFPVFSADPRILGGIVIRVGDRVLDRSLRNRLTQLGKAMRAK